MDNTTILNEKSDGKISSAKELGLETEEDIINLVKEVRQELWEKKDANRGNH